MVASVRGGCLADHDLIFRSTADNAVGAAQLEYRVCSDQFAASWRLFIERPPVKLTSEEEEIRKLALRDLPHNKQKSSDRITSNKESRLVPRSSAFERRAVIH